MIRKADKQLKERWQERFATLPAPARIQLRAALLELREDALHRAEHCWRKHKAPMALYWKVVGVYAGHLARAIPVNPPNLFRHVSPTLMHQKVGRAKRNG